jgi:exopolyphosphatase/pppGpp-phosphohydrolase
MIESTELVWVKHAETGGTAQVPAGAVPQLMQSNWQKMSAKEVADIDKTAAERVATEEEDMRAKAAEGAVVLGEPPESTPEEKNAGRSGKSASKGSE